MNIYFDESGLFTPGPKSSGQFPAVMGIIIPDSGSLQLAKDFELFCKQLSKGELKNGEPKGNLLSLPNRRLLVEVVTAHPEIMLVPVTVNLGATDSSFIEEAPKLLRNGLEETGSKIRSYFPELGRRCGNLSSTQVVKLTAYAIGLMRAIEGILLFYHCRKFHSDYSSIKAFFDRPGSPASREELVQAEIVFIWITQWSRKLQSMTIKDKDALTHPLFGLYGANDRGRLIVDLTKMLDGSIAFADSKVSWQLQLADMLANTWWNVIRDFDGTNEYRSLFRKLSAKTVLPNDSPTGVISVDRDMSRSDVPPTLRIFLRLVAKDTKLLPCRDEQDASPFERVTKEKRPAPTS